MITQTQLKKLLHYDPDSGVFTWVASRGGSYSGSVAGSDDGEGYLRIQISGKPYKAHRLAWFYTYGEWPDSIDHINRVRHDNRIFNLRDGTFSDNLLNKSKPKNNTSGAKGVSWHKNIGKWTVCCRVNGKRKHFGYYVDFELAELVSIEARNKYYRGLNDE